MSSGLAEIVAQAIKIPIARELCLAVLWYVGIRLCINTENWLLLAQLVLAGLAAVVGFWWYYNRGRDKGGGATKVFFLIVMVLMALPLLLLAAKRRKLQEAHRAS